MLRRSVDARLWRSLSRSIKISPKLGASFAKQGLPSLCQLSSSRSFSVNPEDYKFNEVSKAYKGQHFPDFIHSWGRGPFAMLGVGMSGAAVLAIGFGGSSPLWVAPIIGYWIRGYWDIQSEDSILANFPVLGWCRYLALNIRGEIQQYFIETDTSGKPFSFAQRATVYQRSKNMNDTSAFGTVRDVYAEGYEYLTHSLWPKVVDDAHLRFTIGAKSCRHPYSASRLNISAMSYGALSKNAVLALNKGAAHGDFYHNTGEGAISDWHLQPGGDLVWNVGTGYFGCRTDDGKFCPKMFAERAAQPSVKMIEVKLSQGAKPGHGGMLPGGKITAEISRIRGVPMGKDVHSPPMHSAFSTPIELMEFMESLREASGKPVGFKLCVGCPTEMMSLIRAAQETGLPPDFITVDGGEGGTGAAPKEFSNSVGTPMRSAVAFVHDALVGAGIRGRVTLIVSGKILTGTDMVKVFAMGGDVCNAARSFLFSLGCIQALQCNSNKCPTGITTQNPELVKGLVVEEKWKRVYLYHKNTIKNMAELVGACGVDNPTHVRREKVFRRTNQETTATSYLQIYPREEPGSLLKGEARPNLQNAWNDAGVLLEYFSGKKDVKPIYMQNIGPDFGVKISDAAVTESWRGPDLMR